ncbi:DUF2141 domain-containing protein [Trichothermofontia sichuanensis B231]|uniref:DUF2141 domain-containing protein n=1 Tax=Trichothermofontia sichuanensis TaxID=3045816 RepID=UPI002246F8F0|nr:DUF2141 domain-containing protein [Trichothermofontia sichuanensis]UZQ54974.1 DUF2141 domain-containing protein [Trichothermofontia sichuanensis B231]
MPLVWGGLVPMAMAQNFTGSLQVEIVGLRDRTGDVCINLFDRADGFPHDREKARVRQCLPLAEQSEDAPIVVTFADLPVGSYAVSLFHDRNQDGVLNRGELGIPSEGFGFSNNAPVRTGPPKFGNAMVIVAGATPITVQVRYSLQ